MIKGEILARLMDVKKAAILKILLNSQEELCLKEITDKSRVSMTSTFRILQELGEMGIVNRREWKTSKVYSCYENEKVDLLKDLFNEEFEGVQEFLELVNDFPGISQILLQSKTKKRANVLLIGEGIDSAKIREVCEVIQQKGFEVQFLPLAKVQYDQMVKMGLYSGNEKVLK